jgi:AmmeMemoRadiSam system protein B
MLVRQAAVAGTFYPHDATELRSQVVELLEANSCEGAPPKVLIVPHAGYLYSGPIAASAYSRLRSIADQIERVVLLGPSHRVPLDGIALPESDAFETPLGVVEIDKSVYKSLLKLDPVCESERAHRMEHSLEVHLPFLQIVLPKFKIVPLVVGSAEPEEVAEVIESLWGGKETLVVVSSDLSHYHPYEEAEELDAETTRAIQQFDSHLDGEQACGCAAINGMMIVADKQGLKVSVVDLRNSGDTAGCRESVVGYGAYELH